VAVSCCDGLSPVAAAAVEAAAPCSGAAGSDREAEAAPDYVRPPGGAPSVALMGALMAVL
jgi:hypothetical protein